jgi:tetratricopeptide (TPR) repeat protein
MALLGRGFAMLTSGQFDRAIVALGQVIARSTDDVPSRVLRARAYLSKNDTSNAMLDLNYALTARPDNAEALTVRGLGWSALHEYANALNDLNQALGKLETVEGYFARAKIYELRNDVPNATADFRRATELKPKGIFDLLAQAEAKKRIQSLSKRVPCGNTGRPATEGECL